MIVGELYSEDVKRKIRSKNMVYARHQELKQASHQSKHTQIALEQEVTDGGHQRWRKEKGKEVELGEKIPLCLNVASINQRTPKLDFVPFRQRCESNQFFD